jgi:hypothetical protein
MRSRVLPVRGTVLVEIDREGAGERCCGVRIAAADLQLFGDPGQTLCHRFGGFVHARLHETGAWFPGGEGQVSQDAAMGGDPGPGRLLFSAWTVRRMLLVVDICAMDPAAKFGDERMVPAAL